jgi:hypothetical protein
LGLARDRVEKYQRRSAGLPVATLPVAKRRYGESKARGEFPLGHADAIPDRRHIDRSWFVRRGSLRSVFDSGEGLGKPSNVIVVHGAAQMAFLGMLIQWISR